MIITNSKGSKYYPYVYLGNSRKKIYYDTNLRRKAGGWLVNIKTKPKFGNRACERRMRQMQKQAVKKLYWTGNMVLSNKFLQGVVYA